MTKKHIPKIIIEPPKEETIFSLIEYKRENYLTVVDNITDDFITAYVMDYVEQEGILSSKFIELVNNWYNSNPQYPLSIEFSKLGITHITKNVYKTFDTRYVSRFIGSPLTWDLNKTPKIKRKKVSFFPESPQSLKMR